MDSITHRGVEMVERRKERRRKYYLKSKGLEALPPEEDRRKRLLESARKQLAHYERQKASQRQKRHEAGLLPRGRPCKCKETSEQLLDQLAQLEHLEREFKERLAVSSGDEANAGSL